MYVFDNRIELSNKSLLDEYFNGYEYETSGLSFSAMYMWREINEFSWDIFGDYMCMTGISHLELEKKESFLFPPLTKDGKYDSRKLRESILEAKDVFESKNQRFQMRLVPGHMVGMIEEAFDGKIEVIDDRPNYDYIYRRSDLATLRGKRLHAKKNYVNSFKKNFEYRYENFTSDMADEAMDFIAFFNSRKEIPPEEMDLLKMEEEAMRDVFENIEKGGYLGGAIYVDDKLQALTVGGPLGRKSLTCHIEKANVDFRGLYPTICYEFANHMPEHIEYINREEDMGIPNLRKAKLSFKPIKLLDKYIINLK